MLQYCQDQADIDTIMSSEDTPKEAAAAAAPPPAEEEETSPSKKLSGKDIGDVLSAKGPVVKCVLLRHMRLDGKDTKPHPTSSVAHAVADHLKTSEDQHRPVLTELIEEVSVDTTPSNNQIAQVLGGPFTFVGQFPTEGTVVMARKQLDMDAATLAEQSIHTLRELCKEWDIDTSKMVEKTELVQALLDAAPELPINPHRLQPPLEGLVIRGDLLLLKVAETPEEADEDPEKEIHVMSNEEFFLDYTKEEYVAFATRTDVVAPPSPSTSEDEEAGDEDEEDEDADYVLGEEDEEERSAMLNLILGEVIKHFREENGRGPDTRELLELRSQVAEKLGVEVASFDQINDTPEGKKRSALEAPSSPSPKKVKFDEAAAVAATAAESKQDDVEEEDSKKQATKPIGEGNGNQNAQEPS